MKLSFAAINPYIQDNKIDSEEKIIGNLIKWGSDNKYPNYLDELYKNVPTLRAIIDACVDYTAGEEVKSESIISNDELEELVKEISLSYYKFGGFALNILRNRMGIISKICVMDFRTLRFTDDCKKILYSKKFANRDKYRTSTKTFVLDLFNPEDKTQMSSVFYYSNSKYTHYPIPMYEAAITACEIEKSIDEYHLNNINNGFVGSVIVNLNNGTPDDEIKEEIEREFNEKFTGKENAGRVVISYNDDKEHGATIEKIDNEDFSERYSALAARSKQAIFTSFRMTPTLAGIPTENNGFSAEQYAEQYALFYTTVIRPVQKLIVNKLKYILNTYIEIVPFKIDFDNSKNINNIN